MHNCCSLNGPKFLERNLLADFQVFGVDFTRKNKFCKTEITNKPQTKFFQSRSQKNFLSEIFTSESETGRTRVNQGTPSSGLQITLSMTQQTNQLSYKTIYYHSTIYQQVNKYCFIANFADQNKIIFLIKGNLTDSTNIV